MDIINLTVPNVSLCFLILSRDHKKIKIKRCNLYIHCLILCVPPPPLPPPQKKNLLMIRNLKQS